MSSRLSSLMLAVLLLAAAPLWAAEINVPADHVTIQGAINAAAAGDTVIVAAGTYNERLTINKPLTLRGAQAGIDPTAAGARANAAAESIITEAGLSTPNPDVLVELAVGADNVVIDGFTLVGDQTNTTADTCTIRCWTSGVTVRNNIIDGAYGLLNKGSNGLTVQDNRFTINKVGVTLQPGVASNVTITGNTFTLGSAPFSDTQAVYLTGVTGATISDNTATGFGGSAIAGSGNNQIKISGNSLTGCRDGVNFWGDTNFVTITGNVISDSSRFGINIKGRDILISGNAIFDNSSYGINIDKNVGETERVVIRSNNLFGNGGYDLMVTSLVTMTVDARFNYWGGEPATLVSGNASYTPYAAAELDLGQARAYQVSKTTLAAGKPQFSMPHGTGDNPFAFDWDSLPPEMVAGAPAGFGTSSFFASVNATAPLASDRYRTLRIGLRSLFGREVTIGEVASVRYQTKKPAPQTAIDWRLSIYTTVNPAGGNMSSWYRNRIQTHTSAALNLDAPADQWNIWSTATGANQLRFYTNRPGFTSENLLFSELAGGPVTRGTSTWDFSGEEIMMIDLTLGANSGGGTGESQIDAVIITLASGEVAQLDLTAGSAWKVATVHGHDQFTISPDGSGMLFHEQPRNTHAWYWYQNNGAAADVLATGGKQVPDGWRDGSRTFAMTDIAVGKKLNELKLVVEFDSPQTTINFFITDGNGKFGIFAPASGGLASIAQTQLLPDGWTRMTIDLTRIDIADSASVAIYEHNGFVNEYGDPFTAMTWGDIKNYTIAGMFDYQRSPALGWSSWGTMFNQMNLAGEAAISNGYGVAFIWGDTVGNPAYATTRKSLRNVVLSVDGLDYVATFQDAQIRDIIALNVPADSLYVKPGEPVQVALDLLNLQQPVVGCQALMGFDPAYMTFDSMTAAGTTWDVVHWIVSGGDTINSILGVQFELAATSADATIAVLNFTAGSAEGVTEVFFRPDLSDVESTFLADELAAAVYPTKLDSQLIVIDGTAPVVTIAALAQGGANVVVGSGQNALQGVVEITVTASDNLAGYDGRPQVTVEDADGFALVVTDNGDDGNGAFYYTVAVDSATANGPATVQASLADRSGNVGSAAAVSFNVNKNQISGQIQLEGFAGVNRVVTFVATGPGVRQVWTPTLTFTGDTASFVLTDVADGVSGLSAKTSWNLRRKLPVSADASGQTVAAFTGASLLLGGDVNGTNSVNMLDYAVLKTNWMTTAAAADVDGSGVVNVMDYNILKTNWFEVGDAE